MTRQHDLEYPLRNPSCSSFEITDQYFPWLSKNIVVLCFDWFEAFLCYSFDGNSIGKLSNTIIGDSNFGHNGGGLIKYKRSLLTVGGWGNRKTEILERNSNGAYIWSTVEPDFDFTEWNFHSWKHIQSHSLVNIKSSNINEEYVLLSGGSYGGYDDDGPPPKIMERIYKFNGTWHPFGQLRRPRTHHSSIYWNGAVYFIGGYYSFRTVDENWRTVDENSRVRMEIWKIPDIPDRFETTENWPELFNWDSPHLFIVQDSFFPDH